jgi:hypothetical protein
LISANDNTYENLRGSFVVPFYSTLRKMTVNSEGLEILKGENSNEELKQ